MKPQYKSQTLHKLEEAYDLIYADVVRAVEEADKILSKLRGQDMSYVHARAQMVFYAANVSLKHPRRREVDVYALKSFFEKEGYKEETALLIQWIVRGEFLEGRHDQARQLDGEYDKLYASHAPIKVRIMNLVGKANFSLQEWEPARQLETALRAEALMAELTVHDVWYHAYWCMILQIKADALSHSQDSEAALRLVEESIAVAENNGVSAHIALQSRYYAAIFRMNQGKDEEALPYLLEMLERLPSSSFFGHIAASFLIMLAQLYNTLFDKNTGDKGKQQECLDGMSSCIDRLTLLPAEVLTPKQQGFVFLRRARLYSITGRHREAVSLLAAAMRLFYRHEFHIHIGDVYLEASDNYNAWGLKENNPTLLNRSFVTARRALDDIYAYNRREAKEQMEALINKYELQKKELNEKLLLQKVEAMNKEIHLANINLQEKIMVLDELKVYVDSLKRSSRETNQLIHHITQKIDKAILTEQEKANLQEKMDGGNSDFYKLLTEKHPVLTNLEVHICSLLKTGMTDKELSKVYGQSDKSYEQHRYRIKKKLRLSKEENLVRYLNRIEAEMMK